MSAFRRLVESQSRGSSPIGDRTDEAQAAGSNWTAATAVGVNAGSIASRKGKAEGDARSRARNCPFVARPFSLRVHWDHPHLKRRAF
jgi:hypothetical protein